MAILYSNERYLRAEFMGTIYFNINIPIAEKKPFFYFSYANLTKYIRQNLYALTALHFLFLNPFQCIFSRWKRIWYPFYSNLKNKVFMTKQKFAILWRFRHGIFLTFFSCKVLLLYSNERYLNTENNYAICFRIVIDSKQKQQFFSIFH